MRVNKIHVKCNFQILDGWCSHKNDLGMFVHLFLEVFAQVLQTFLVFFRTSCSIPIEKKVVIHVIHYLNIGHIISLPVGVPETRIHHDDIRPNIIMFPAVIFQIILQCFTETTSYEVESYLKVNLKKI